MRKNYLWGEPEERSRQSGRAISPWRLVTWVSVYARWPFLTIGLASVFWSGCITLLPYTPTPVKKVSERTAVVLANVKLPLTIQTRKLLALNDPLARRDRLNLQDMALLLANQETSERAAAISAVLKSDADRTTEDEQNRFTPVNGEAAWCSKRRARFMSMSRKVRRYECFDTLQDLQNKNTIVLVAISGGGTRAATLAANTLSLLETTYREVQKLAQVEASENNTLFHMIDGYSTVSGGSICAYWVARVHATLYKGWPEQNDDAVVNAYGFTPGLAQAPDPQKSPYTDFFYRVATDRNTKKRTSDGGAAASILYLSPENVGIPLLSTLLTDRSFTNLMTVGLDQPPWGIVGMFHPGFLLGQLPPTPRFLFNATALETGTPFVLTRSITHLPGRSPVAATARFDLDPKDRRAENERLALFRPFSHGLTLEDLNSSPADFPLAYAAMASAAYPVGLEPVTLRKLQFDPAEQKIIKSETELRLTDGGVYDNSGLTTALDLFESLIKMDHVQGRQGKPRKRLILLAINADVPEDDVALIHRLDAQKSKLAIPLGTDYPVPFGSAVSGMEGLNLIHATNKRRSEQVASERVQKLTAQRYDVLYFPVHLMQLLPSDPHRIEADPKLLSRIKEIDTDLVIDSDGEQALKEAAGVILNAEQHNTGWSVGPACGSGQPKEVTKLSTAFAMALLRANAEDGWTNPDALTLAGWCPPGSARVASEGEALRSQSLKEVQQWHRDGLITEEVYRTIRGDLVTNALRELQQSYQDGELSLEAYQRKQLDLLRSK